MSESLSETFHRIAEEPIDGALDRFTWRAAWLAAASIAEGQRCCADYQPPAIDLSLDTSPATMIGRAG